MTEVLSEKPKILFVHMSTGAQFDYFARWLGANNWDVRFAYVHENKFLYIHDFPKYQAYPEAPSVSEGNMLYSADYGLKNAYAFGQLFSRLREDLSYIPDVVIAHVGWGVGLMVKLVWPETCYVAYHEWYYSNYDWDKRRHSAARSLGQMINDRGRNLLVTGEFDLADMNWSPTAYQASRFPPSLRKMLQHIPDGVDTDFYQPRLGAVLDEEWLSLKDDSHILTYATRGMEPLRGFPQFLEALSILQKRRSDFHTIIMADEREAYAVSLDRRESWRMKMMDRYDFDQSRIHVFGMRPRQDYLKILQASSAHIYFTEPFVTSWSLSEALATGCLVIGSDTAPVVELISDGENGILVDMDEANEIADAIEWAFDHPEEAMVMRQRARSFILENFDSDNVFKHKQDIIMQYLQRKKTPV